MEPREIREKIRRGEWTGPTPGLAPGYAQANLVVLPKEWAFEFLLFCQRNPKPCPVLDVTEVGSPHPARVAPDADLRTDIPKYRIYRYGQLEAEVTEITDYWRDDLVAFLIGCSFTFEAALMAAGIPVRHIEEGRNVPMYITNIECVPAGPFRGPMVVSMRPIPYEKVPKAVTITARYPKVHGAPIHIGDPSAIGIEEINEPDFGDAVTIKPGEAPVFWACGVTPQVVAREAKPELMITHSPGHMFITDVRNEELADF
ncbi:MAG: putative hydro-lyase [Chloroflexi bacterium]|nr:MAG: putative hydro-lyase [Chloroflexota bacterium]